MFCLAVNLEGVFVFMEIWKDIKGFENTYQISNYGRVKNLARYTNSKNGSKSFKRERILKYDKSKKNKRGQFYLRVTLSKENKQKRLQVHRIVAKHFLDKVEGKNIINHIDGNPENNHYSNLEWCTHSENELHSYNDLGKISKARKLTEDQVRWIRKNAIKGIGKEKRKDSNIMEICEKYSVTKGVVLRVLSGKSYKDVV